MNRYELTSQDRREDKLIMENRKLKEDIKELNDRAIEKTNSYLDCDVRKNKRIQELEAAIEAALFIPDKPQEMRGLLRNVLYKDKKRYE